MTDAPMTKSERSEFVTFTRNYVRTLKARGEEHASVLLAVFEEQLAREFEPKEEMWAEAVEMAEQAVAETNEKIKEHFRARGLNLKRAPSLNLAWSNRGENAVKQRREELRRVAEAQAEVVKKKAVAEGERVSLETQQQILVGDYSREEAKALVFGLPRVEELMPPLQYADVVALAQQRNREGRREAPWAYGPWALEAGDDDDDDE